MTTISAKMIKDSITEDGRRLTTILTESPLSYHPQNLTHRMFSRNASSSRAQPSTVIIQNVIDDPVYPVRWSKNQRGMQGFEDLDPDKIIQAIEVWDAHRASTLDATRKLNELGLHKQYANRLLTPHQHIKVLWTTVSWDNFMHLRNHPDAQPEEQLFAQAVQEVLDNSTPEVLLHGQWHLPWIREEDWNLGRDFIACEKGLSFKEVRDIEVLELMKNISASRCATLSYGNANGSPSTFDKDLARIGKLMTDPLHASPFEHQATPDKLISVQKSILINDEWVEQDVSSEWEHPELHGNLTGFIQYRKTMPNEAVGV